MTTARSDGSLPRRLLLVVAAVVVLVAGCASEPAAMTEAEPPAFTYVAVGASETVGVGADDPRADAWPSVFHRTALSPSATLVNVGVSGATVREAIERELPAALAAEPQLVTVWLNVNDLVRGVPVADYERDLRTLVRGLRREGRAEVLVATTPPIADLPVVRACLPGGSGCQLPGGLPSVAVIDRAVAAYDAAIRRVVEAEGAVVVDLGAAAGGRIDADLVARDGFHPSTEGHRRVAAAFTEVLRSLPSAASLQLAAGSATSG